MTITNKKSKARPANECKKDLRHLAWDVPNNLVLVQIDTDHATWYQYEKKSKASLRKSKEEPVLQVVEQKGLLGGLIHNVVS